jgi:hypothetical protein
MAAGTRPVDKGIRALNLAPAQTIGLVKTVTENRV